MYLPTFETFLLILTKTSGRPSVELPIEETYKETTSAVEWSLKERGLFFDDKLINWLEKQIIWTRTTIDNSHI